MSSSLASHVKNTPMIIVVATIPTTRYFKAENAFNSRNLLRSVYKLDVLFTFIKLSPNSYMVFCGIIAVDIILCMHQHFSKKISIIQHFTPILLLGRLAFYLYYVRYSTDAAIAWSILLCNSLTEHFLFTNFVPPFAWYLLLRLLGGGPSSVIVRSCQAFSL